jgi:signal peptidase
MPVPHRITRLARRTLDVLLGVIILVVVAIVVVARVIPVVTGGATFVVGGGSMEPAISTGSLVIATPVPAAQLAPGDVVSVRVGEKQAVFTHRVVRVVDREGDTWLETKGDANDEPDPSIIPATSVIGRVAVTVPYAGYAVWLTSTAPGLMFVLSLAVLVLAGAWLLESMELDYERARRRAASVMTASSETAAGEAATG